MIIKIQTKTWNKAKIKVKMMIWPKIYIKMKPKYLEIKIIKVYRKSLTMLLRYMIQMWEQVNNLPKYKQASKRKCRL